MKDAKPLIFALSILAGTTGHAALRTFVSATTGADANLCTRTQPCRTFAAAMAQTDPAGEVVVLDSGGYGPVTISQSVTLISPEGIHAAITVTETGVSAITVDTDNIVVILRGLTLNGLGFPFYGIDFTGQTSTPSQSYLHVENCVINGFALWGVNFRRSGNLFLRGVTIRHCGRLGQPEVPESGGIYVTGSPGAAAAEASIEETSLDGNRHGLIVGYARVSVGRSVAAGNDGRGFAVVGVPPNWGGLLMVDHSAASGNDRGFHAGGFAATLRVSNSAGTDNTLDVVVENDGALLASQNVFRTGAQTGTGYFVSYQNNEINTFSGTITPEGLR